MTAINEYIRSLTKCNNPKCELAGSCLRFHHEALSKFEAKDCEYYFGQNLNSVDYLKNILGGFK